MEWKKGHCSLLLVLLCVCMLALSVNALADDGLSDDNSLTSLGITTQGVTVTPEFSYDVWTYDVEVPAGTTELALSPVTSNPNASISDISGTTLDSGGNGKVVITVTSESGNAIEYTLNVTAQKAAVDPATAISENEASTSAAVQPETQTEVQTEDPRYVKVDKNSLQEAENTIERLQKEMQVYKDRNHLFSYVIYALIAIAVIFLFLIINLVLKRKDLSHELKEIRKNDLPPRMPSGGQDGFVQGMPDSGCGQGGYRQRPPYQKEDPHPQSDEWDDWETPDPKSKKKKKNKKQSAEAPQQGRVNSQTSWTQAQVGTPVPPARMPSSAGSVNYGGPAAQLGAQKAKGRGVPEETRMYRSSEVQAFREVPDDETKNLSKVSRAQSKAMKRAAAQKAQVQPASDSSAPMGYSASPVSGMQQGVQNPGPGQNAVQDSRQPDDNMRNRKPSGRTGENGIEIDMVDL